MISLLKDIFNPINWFKLFKNPKKIRILYFRLFSYPGMNFKNIRIRILRNINKNFLVLFLNFLARKNKNLNYFFYSETAESQSNNFELKNITFQLDKNREIINTAYNALQNYGIIIIENILSEKERKKIIDVFNNFNQNKNVVNLSSNQKSIDVKVELFDTTIDEFKELNMFNKEITKRIFGRNVSAQGQFLIHESINIPETIFPGDNNLHMDRYLPNIKTIYFPYDINYDQSPFMYAPKSHKINHEYKKFYLNNDECIFDERNEKSKHLIKNKNKISVKKNSLVIACTNGFHGRSPFERHGKRFTLFMTYPNFDLFDLFNYFNLNRVKN